MSQEFPPDRTSNEPAQLLGEAVPSTDRRGFLRLAGTGMAGLAVGGVIAPVGRPGTPEPACTSKPAIEVEVSTAITFLSKVSSLLPTQAQIITKIVAALNDFNKFYQAGDFTSAGKFFDTIDADATQLVADVGVNLSPSIKIALALADAAISAIGVLLNSQKNVPAVMAAKRQATPEQMKAISAVERRTEHAEKLFAAIQR
jgi:hypothetical protein